MNYQGVNQVFSFHTGDPCYKQKGTPRTVEEFRNNLRAEMKMSSRLDN
ncbi:MAG: hypothetical protein ACTMUB_06745 [cyanobacterium endosymbiont of Rhopalodia musculus]